MASTLVFGAVAALIALLLFNSGMLANAKTRLQNAVDAGAYSAALLQARDHNFAARSKFLHKLKSQGILGIPNRGYKGNLNARSCR
jgi:hypothetical protein